MEPSLQLAIVACMDSRLNVFDALGLEDGQAHVLRNAGGVITDDVIRSLALSQRKLGTREIILIHHTDCGLEKVTDDGFRAELQEETGMAPPSRSSRSPTSRRASAGSIARIRNSPVPARIATGCAASSTTSTAGACPRSKRNQADGGVLRD